MRFIVLSMFTQDNFRFETDSFDLACLLQECGFYVTDTQVSGGLREMLVVRGVSI